MLILYKTHVVRSEFFTTFFVKIKPSLLFHSRNIGVFGDVYVCLKPKVHRVGMEKNGPRSAAVETRLRWHSGTSYWSILSWNQHVQELVRGYREWLELWRSRHVRYGGTRRDSAAQTRDHRRPDDIAIHGGPATNGNGFAPVKELIP